MGAACRWTLRNRQTKNASGTSLSDDSFGLPRATSCGGGGVGRRQGLQVVGLACRNQLAGLTFRCRGVDGISFVKWLPAHPEFDVDAEAARLRWPLSTSRSQRCWASVTDRAAPGCGPEHFLACQRSTVDGEMIRPSRSRPSAPASGCYTIGYRSPAARSVGRSPTGSRGSGVDRPHPTEASP